MKDAIEALLKFFLVDITWRKTLTFFILACIAVGSVLAYDRYTAKFTLARLAESADLVTKLQAIESSSAKQSPELEQIYKNL